MANYRKEAGSRQIVKVSGSDYGTCGTRTSKGTELSKTERCTVHASPDCLDPDGPTFSGRGWDHDGADPRIECSACTKVMTA